VKAPSDKRSITSEYLVSPVHSVRGRPFCFHLKTDGGLIPQAFANRVMPISLIAELKR